MLWLEALSEEESERLLDELLAAELPPRLREIVVGGAEGNPFFVEELLSTLIDQGVLARDDGRWSVRDLPAGFAVPDSVQALLAARIDLLGPNEKAGLQAASVIGRIFWRGPVRELLDGIDPDCAMLEDRDFVRRRSGSTLVGEEEYAFKHQLTREVAYASLPKARRAHLHARFADWLERAGEGRDEHAAFLAHHYAEAVRPEDVDLAWAREEVELERLRGKGVHRLRRAAELAVGRYDIDEAIPLLHRALELEDDELALSLLWRELGRANALKYDGPAFWDAMQRSLAVCRDRLTRADTYAELAFQTIERAGMWRQAPARDLVHGWIEQALELAEPESRARAKALIARVLWSEGTEPEAASEAHELAERLGDPELRAAAWQARSFAEFRVGRFDDSLAWAQRPFELESELRDPEMVADLHWTPIPAAIMLGRFREDEQLLERALHRFEKLGLHWHAEQTRALLEA
jgi:hypothetical protein